MTTAVAQPGQPGSAVRRRWRPRFGLKSLLILVTLAAIVCAVAVNWEYIPGTFYNDGNRNPHGTGWDTLCYVSGNPMERAYYRAGELCEKIWYKPDGSVAATSTFHRDGINVSYAFRQDGSLELMFQCRYAFEEGFHRYHAHGTFIRYRPDGKVERCEEYEDGVPTIPESK